METKKLKISDVYSLRAEISSLLPLKINHLFKTELIELFDRTAPIIESVEKVRKELVTEHLGEIAPGATEEQIQEMLGFPNFRKAFGELLDEERDVEYIPIKRKYLDFESDTVIPQVYKLMEKE